MRVSGGEHFIRDGITLLYVTYEPVGATSVNNTNDIREEGKEITDEELERRAYRILMESYYDDVELISELLDREEIKMLLNSLISGISEARVNRIADNVYREIINGR